MTWETVIGIEVHVQLATQSKLFSGAPTTFGAEVNSQVCPIDGGHPGVLPVLNQQAVHLAIRFGVSINAAIAASCVFARKHYFYPDLPKGYQISQYDQPIVGQGSLEIDLADGSTKTIGITRAHLEEDAGKSVHGLSPDHSGIDLNRAGVPLLEIVSEPDIRSAAEAVSYLKALHQLVRAIGISDANMQEGSFRADINISLRKQGTQAFGTRTEIKNVNSFKFIEQAIHYEQARQQMLLDANEPVIQETRGYDESSGKTRSLRSKEDAHDYRYFPDPDLLPVSIPSTLIDRIRHEIPELPRQKLQRYTQGLLLSQHDAKLLIEQPELAQLFDSIHAIIPDVSAKLIANWLIGPLTAQLKQYQDAVCPISVQQLARLLQLIDDKTLPNHVAKTVFDIAWRSREAIDQIIKDNNLLPISDLTTIDQLIDQILEDNPQQLAQYQAGKEQLLGYFVGQVMKATQGKADPAVVNRQLSVKLKQTIN